MKAMRARKMKDIEITFVGMAFIIDGCINVINDAVDTILKIEMPTCWWILMPWKVISIL
jgi:hypothetical protein